ncbi:MAM domain-containing protein, meprin/A5/mu, partial [Hyunsoonleella jejuensis]
MNKTTYKKIGILVIFNLLFSYGYSQVKTQTPKRIAISNPSTLTLQNIQNAGIDLSCGPKFVNNTLQMELSYAELLLLDNNGITYNVLIDDLTGYYKQKFEAELPLAKTALRREQDITRLNRAKRSANKTLSLKNAPINNPAQHDECSEIDWSAPTNFKLGSMGGAFTLSEAYAELDLMRSMYPNLISVRTDASTSNTKTHGNTTGGTTWAGQPIYYVKISDFPDLEKDGNGSDEPETLITGAMHAREISSVMNTFYFMWYILENYNTDPFIKNLVDNHEIYIIPISNPDGYRWNEVIAPSGGGLQRKNLRPGVADNGTTNSLNNVRGVDLNRNFNYYWGWDDSGSSPSPSSNTYRGPSAGSEPETQIVQEFITSHNIKVAVNHHGGLNSIVTSSYNGESTAADSGREDEYAKICHDLTHYNRYIYGSAPNTLYEANGDVNDWMLGGPAVTSGGQTNSGSGMDVLAFAPENGDDFWPTTTLIVDIARRAMRMNYLSVLYSGKFAKLHDLNASSINTTSGNLNFGVEYLGKTYDDITLSVTPVSSNITSMTSPSVQSGWSKLEQRNLSVPFSLNPGIQPNDQIEFQVTLSNDDFIIYRANFIKYYQPTVIFQDADNISNWNSTGNTNWGTSTDAFIGSTSITDTPSGSYGNNEENILTLGSGASNTELDLSLSTAVLIQFYAKWDLERNYDLVQLEAKSDNAATGWIPLCGRYNKPAATSLTNFHLTKTTGTHQSGNGETVYDGDSMDKWVMEEIFINATNNTAFLGQSDVEIRFRLKSDSSNREDDLTTTFDGFYFDDFKVISLNDNIPQSITFTPIDGQLTISPDFTINATASSGLPVTYSILSGPATITGNTISLTGSTGTVIVQASQAGNASYIAANNVTESFEVTLPVCTGTTISSFPYNENFNSGFGDWTQDNGDDGNWTRRAGSTLSGNTGPSDDYTSGQEYVFVDASNVSGSAPENIGQNATAYLISPCFDLSGYQNASFSFYYYMYGAQMGTLSIDISTDYGNSYSPIPDSKITTNGTNPGSNPISGQQQSADNQAWRLQSIDLSDYDGQVIQLRFTGITGTSFRSDIAFDEINFTANAVSSTTWYADTDSDSFGDPNVSQVAATQPVGFVANNTDCDDTDANEFPGQTWYIDADGDDFGTSSLTACERPTNGFLLSELSGTGIDDCDDNDADEFPGQTWYIGVDNDSDTYFGSVTSVTACEQPVGYSLVAPATPDCDDNDADEFPGQTWYIGVDNDNDTYFGSVSSVTACEQPVGYSLV